MKQGIGKQLIGRFLRKAGLPAVALGAALALAAPATVLARGPEGGHGGGHSFSQGGRSFSGGGRSFGGGQRFSAPAPAYRGGGNYRGGGAYYGGGNYYRGGGGHDYDRHYYRGYGYGYGYYGAPAYGFGFSYAPNPCNPGGYYDAYGQWIPYPGCYVAPPYAAPYAPGY